MSFNTIVEKVDYIEKNFTELKPVLLNDDALASMLIDMMHDKKFDLFCNISFFNDCINHIKFTIYA